MQQAGQKMYEAAQQQAEPAEASQDSGQKTEAEDADFEVVDDNK